jgi:phosphatidylserine/phosphatidylglycerophosphate/cardiolipin synthase-like enzyme
MLNFKHPSTDKLPSSKLYDQDNFYTALLNDIGHAKRQVIIESPFMTARRVSAMLPTFRKLRKRNVKIVINTKPLNEHDPVLYSQAQIATSMLQDLDIIVLHTVGHHRKLAIIDQEILWEGSLNILSQNDSCEFMRRIDSAPLANQMIDFIKVSKFLR